MLRGSNPRRNQVYSTGTVGRRNYPSSNLYQQYVPKTLTKSTGTRQASTREAGPKIWLNGIGFIHFMNNSVIIDQYFDKILIEFCHLKANVLIFGLKSDDSWLI